MAAPKLIIQPWTLAQSLNNSGVLDLSALTSPGGVYSERQGSDGTDWIAVRSWSPTGSSVAADSFGLYQFKAKNTGTLQLAPEPFAPVGVSLYGGQIFNLTPRWEIPDYRHSYGGANDDGNGAAALGIPDSVVDVGIRVPGLIAKRGEERTAVFLWRVNSGVWVASAGIADGSSPRVSLPQLNAPRDTDTDYCFAVTYTPGPDADSGVTVEMRMVQSIATYTRFICPQVAYIQPPRRLPVSKGYRHYLRAQGAFGGVHA